MLKNKNSSLRLSLFIVSSIFMLGFSSASAEEVSGYIPGEFNVDDSGSATYMIPLEIPAGIADVQPKLSLNFNSGGGNGLLGQGWSLSGLSAISRCPQTLAQDGFSGTISYDKNDRFCMDGQRLIPVDQTPIDYYTLGREYRTEIDSISRIIAHGGTIEGGPSHFIVNTKAGETVSYGEGSSASRVGSATGSILSWALHRLTDVVGNYYQIEYKSEYGYRCPNDYEWTLSEGVCVYIDNPPLYLVDYTFCPKGGVLEGGVCVLGSGVFDFYRPTIACPSGSKPVGEFCQKRRTAIVATENYATRLSYTGLHYISPNVTAMPTGLPTHVADFDVRIEYEARSDSRSAFVGGFATWMGKRIKTIRAGKVDGATFNEYGRYEFEYLANSANEVALSRLSKLTKFSGNNSFKSTEFEWTQNVAGSAWQQSDLWKLPIALTDGNNKAKFNGVNLFDVNGDGRVDVLHSREHHSKATWLGSDDGWVKSNGYAMPTDFVSCCDREDDGTRMLDLDGDGFVDAMRNEGNYIKGAWRNTGSGWGSFTGNYVPHFPVAAQKDGFDRGYRLADVNGDGFDDVLQNWYMTSTSGGGGENGNPKTTTTRYRGAWLNDGNAWVSSAEFVPPVELATRRRGVTHNVQLVDVNGDGRTDFLKGREGLPYVTYLSTPSGWVSTPSYSPPAELGDDEGDERGGRFFDLNGDGLVDLLWGRGNYESVYTQGAWLNTGAGWLYNNNYLPPKPIASRKAGEDQGARFGDVNGDGLVDFIYAREGGSYKVWLNTGQGWLEAPNFAPLTAFANANNGYDRGTRVADVNADGMPDLVRAYGGDRRTWLNTYQAPRLLKITDGLGKQISVEYKPLTDSSVYSKTLDSSVSYDRFSERWIVGAGSVVAKTLVTNGIGGQNSLSYKYWAGKANIKGRGMLGFAQKQTTDNQTGTVTTTRYRQDFPYAGRVASVSSAIGSEVISEASFIYDVQTRFGGKVYFPYAKSSVERQLEAGSVISEVETHTTYDLLGHGNATNVVTSTTGGGAKVMQTTSNIYTDDPTIWRLGRLTEAKVEHSYDAALHAYFEGGAITKTSTFEYNTLGLLWKEIVEPTSTELGVTLETVYEYDNFGRTTSSAVTGRLSNNSLQTRTTTTAHSFINYNGEAVSRVITTNAFSHQQEDYYSRKHGGLVYSKGPNGKISTWAYDSFGRKKREDRHDGTYAEISYGQCNLTGCGVHAPAHAAYFMTTINSAGGEATVFKDILGRKLRTVSLGFDGRYAFQDTQYNAKGQVSGVSDAYYGGYKEPGYWTRYIYDERGRVDAEHVPTELHPDPALPGAEYISTERIYNGLEIIEFNQLAQGVTRANNVLGKLVSVTEEIGVGSTVNYYYSAAGELLRTVVGSNEKTLTFDIRGRKKTMIDPDMGSWIYTYNAFGELESQTDAKGQPIQFEYDLLGRKTKQTNAQGESTWHYDSYAGTIALGKLIHVTGAEALYQQSTVYDDALRPISSSMSFDSNNSGAVETFVTELSYDDQGRLQTQHYPSGLKTHNLYDAQGALSAVYRYDRSVLPGTGQSSSYRTLATHFTNQAATQRTNSTTHLHAFTDQYADAQDHWDGYRALKLT